MSETNTVWAIFTKCDYWDDLSFCFYGGDVYLNKSKALVECKKIFEKDIEDNGGPHTTIDLKNSRFTITDEEGAETVYAVMPLNINKEDV